VKTLFSVIFFTLLVHAGYIEDFSGMGLGIVPVRADKSIPAFNAKALDVKSFSDKMISGPAILVFWQVSCPVCKNVLIELTGVRKKIEKEKKKVQVISITADTPGDVMSYFSSNKIELDTVIDVSGEITKVFGVIATPLFYIIDRKRLIRGIIPGAPPVSSDSFWKLIEYLK